MLTKGAADWIVQVYASLRNDELEGNNKKVSSYMFRSVVLKAERGMGLLDFAVDRAYT